MGAIMSFKSKAQAIHMFREHPEIAMEWADKTKSFKKLPERIHPPKPKPEEEKPSPLDRAVSWRMNKLKKPA